MPITLQYAPDDNADFPWLLSVDHAPLIRIADEERAVDALAGAAHHADAPSTEGAVGMALAHTAPGEGPDDDVIGAEDLDQGPAPVLMLHRDQDVDQHKPWVISIDDHPVFRVQHSEYAAGALKAAHPAHNEHEVLDALRRVFTTTPAQAEEITR